MLLEPITTPSAALICESTFTAVFDHLEIGVCLIDSLGRIAYENDEFQRQRKDLTTYAVNYRDELILNRKGDRKIPMKDFAEGRDSAVTAVSFDQNDPGGVLVIETVTLTGNILGTAQAGGFVVLSRDMSRVSEINSYLLRTIYSLTKAETDVSLLVWKGLTNIQIARLRGRAVDTINAQLKAILRKTGTTNRTELVQKMGQLSI